MGYYRHPLSRLLDCWESTGYAKTGTTGLATAMRKKVAFIAPPMASQKNPLLVNSK